MTTEWTLREAELSSAAHDTKGARRASAEAVRGHLDQVLPALESLRSQAHQLAAWGEELALRLLGGQRLLAAGNGGSAAEAQHLTAELVGRFDADRRPFSAISLHAETSAVTAIANDYGFEELFARQVRAHARSGDILMLLSTSGKSPNLLRAAEAAARLN
ncbi:MAG: D-sedoheptulose 7-phosphate isomerase, partial [Actinomycetota bacterium]|nr:D-sedoheptulose 7-phosphate isomerase [Actinomycetota bacterium]